MTLVRLFEELRDAGFKGGYDAVRPDFLTFHDVS
jgi:hypothetical protein